MTSGPDMTLVAITPGDLRVLARLLQRLGAQTIAHRLELVIVAPRRDALRLAEAAGRPRSSRRDRDRSGSRLAWPGADR